MTPAVRRLIERIASGDVNQQDMMLARDLLKKRKRIKQRLPEKRRAETREEKRNTRTLRMAYIHGVARERAMGQCELCLLLMVDGGELHHLEPGSKRRALEAPSNVMMVHPACHRAYHANPERWRTQVEGWTAAHGYPLPSRFRAAARVVRT